MPRRRTPPDQLTEREQQVHARMCQGMSNAEIAAMLCISIKSVETHIGHIYEKLEEPLTTQGPARRAEYLARWLRRG